MTAHSSDKPSVALNLDTLEREGKPEDYAIVLGGKRVVLADAQELDWQTLMVAMNDPHAFFRLIVPEESQEHFFKRKLETWKMRAMMDAYNAHYGLTDPGNPAASPR